MTPRQLENPVSVLERNRMPTEWWLRPDSKDALVGEHSAVVWKLVYTSPRLAMRARLGIRILPPNISQAPKPVSSMTR